MKLSKDHFLKARDFILTNARVLERRLFQFHFERVVQRGFFMPFMPIEILTVDLDTEWNPIQHLQKASPFSGSWPLKHLMKQVV